MTDDPSESQPQPLSTQPRNRPLRAQSYDLPPSGPMHHMHRRHFASQEGMGLLITALIVAVAVYFLGWDFGWWSSPF